jgi:hypothetical protein
MNSRKYIQKLCELTYRFKNKEISESNILSLFEKEGLELHKFLYKFRTCSNKEIDTLRNRSCFFNLPRNWHDTIDSTITFVLMNDKKKLGNDKQVVPLFAYQIADNYLKSLNIESKMDFEDFKRAFKFLYPKGIDYTKEYSHYEFGNRAAMIAQIHNTVKNAFKTVLNLNEIRDHRLMLSLCDTFEMI